MFSLREFYQDQRDHLPLDFHSGDGVRRLFPAGYSGSISCLKRYLFETHKTATADALNASFVFRADGAGRWLLAGVVDYSSFSNPNSGPYNTTAANLIELSFAFAHSDTTSGHGYLFCTTGPYNNAQQWIWATGQDGWLFDHWFDVFPHGGRLDFESTARDPSNYTPATGLPSVNAFTELGFQQVETLGGAQPTCGAGGVPGIPPTVWGTGRGAVAGGLPASADSHVTFDAAGHAAYAAGYSDPWWDGFNYSPISTQELYQPGTGTPRLGPDPLLLVGTSSVLESVTGNRVVYVVVLNNTRHTILNLWSASDESQSADWDADGAVFPPFTIWPAGAGWWSTSNGNDLIGDGTSGSAQYLGNIAGQPPSTEDPLTFTFNWDDPFVGSNSYSAVVPAAYTVTYSGGDGDTAVVIFDVMDAQ
jgi:hypothetical protein